MLPRPRREDAGAGAGDDDGEGGAGDSQNCLKKERRWWHIKDANAGDSRC